MNTIIYSIERLPCRKSVKAAQLARASSKSDMDDMYIHI